MLSLRIVFRIVYCTPICRTRSDCCACENGHTAPSVRIASRPPIKNCLRSPRTNASLALNFTAARPRVSTVRGRRRVIFDQAAGSAARPTSVLPRKLTSGPNEVWSRWPNTRSRYRAALGPCFPSDRQRDSLRSADPRGSSMHRREFIAALAGAVSGASAFGLAPPPRKPRRCAASAY